MTGIGNLETIAERRPITMLTAYDAPTARVVEAAGIDLILVGDSLGNTVLGYDSTIPVTLEEMKTHTAAVVRAREAVPVVADMPFLSYGVDTATSIRNCGEMLKEVGADAVKLESSPQTVSLTEQLTETGIPVMAHVGTRPQHERETGGLAKSGTTEEEATDIVELARAHEAAGAFAIVIEHVPDHVARQVTATVDIPTIGIGAGSETDGQVLVLADVLGVTDQVPPFAERFGDLRSEMESAITAYREAVESETFPDT